MVLQPNFQIFLAHFTDTNFPWSILNKVHEYSIDYFPYEPSVILLPMICWKPEISNEFTVQ